MWKCLCLLNLKTSIEHKGLSLLWGAKCDRCTWAVSHRWGLRLCVSHRDLHWKCVICTACPIHMPFPCRKAPRHCLGHWEKYWWLNVKPLSSVSDWILWVAAYGERRLCVCVDELISPDSEFQAVILTLFFFSFIIELSSLSPLEVQLEAGDELIII